MTALVPEVIHPGASLALRGSDVIAPNPLELLETAKALLVEASDLRAVVDVRDKAEAVRTYVAAAKYGLEMQNEAAELKLRAERKAGELLAEAVPLAHGGDRKSSNTVSLDSVGIKPHQNQRWQRIAALPEAEFEAYVAEAHNDKKELTTAGALKLAKRVVASAKPEAADLPGGDDESAEGTPSAFPVIVIDPPWRYDNVATRGAAEDHYPTMSLDELAALQLPSADNSHLYLWVTNGFLRQGFDLIDAWGFTYKTCLTWVKPQIGMGNWFRNSTEHVLFGVKGRLPTQRNNVPTWFQANRTRHSAKPESFYDLVESCSPGPYLEMFARRRRFGWHVWGNEA